MLRTITARRLLVTGCLSLICGAWAASGATNIEARASSTNNALDVLSTNTGYFILSGKVTGEMVVQKLVRPNFYMFTIDTGIGYRTITVNGNSSSAKFDTLINGGDEIVMRLRKVSATFFREKRDENTKNIVFYGDIDSESGDCILYINKKKVH